MPNVTFTDMVLLLNAGDWCMLQCGYSLARGAELTRATVEADTLRLECGPVVIEKKLDRMYAKVIGGADPREIQITGPHMVRQQRKKIDGGGWHEVEQTGLLFRFVHTGAEARREASRWQQREARSRQEAERKREDAKKRAKDAKAAAVAERTVELPVEDGGHVKCFVLICDWKESHDSKAIIEAIRLVFDGKNCPTAIDVPDTESDELALVISSLAINAKQAQTVWNLYLDNLRREHQDWISSS